jgi:hydroxypyruvate isomerase
MGKHSGLVAQIKEVASDAKFVHCSIHLEPLATRKMPAVLKTVLTEAVKVVNFIKSRAMNSRLFSNL